jgi:amino acid adenylation domain-containing protein
MQQEAAMSFRLSPQQEQLWTAKPEGPTGCSRGAILLEGPLESVRLHKALGRVVERHEILRTTFRRQSGIRLPLQVVREALEPTWGTTDLRALAADEQAAKIDEALAVDTQRPWDFEAGPLVRAQLVSLSPDRHLLVLTAAAVCVDSGSMTTIARELARIYGDSSAELGEDPLQYADFAEWQNELLTADDEEAQAGRQFWEEDANGATDTIPFLQRTAPTQPTEIIPVELDSDTLHRIDQQASHTGVTGSVLVQAAWHVLLGRLSGADEFVVAATSSERSHAELESAVGAFARPLPLRSRLAGNPTFTEVATQLMHTSDLAARWQDYAPPAAAHELSIGFSSTEPLEGTRSGEVSFSLESVAGNEVPAPLVLDWTQADGRQAARIRFDPDALELDQAQRIAKYLGHVLKAVAAQPDARIDDLELLDADDVRRLTVDVNATSAPVTGRSIHELFASAATRAAERPSVVDAASAITYAELDARANQLAHRLRRAGVAPDVIVGLCTDRSVDMVVGLLGILKAGGAYLPLNFEHPPARLQHQLRETGSPALVTQQAVLGRLPAFDGEIVCIDRDRASLDSEPTEAPEALGSPDDLAYVIYTSGSTGTPKGVGVTHANLVNYVEAIASQLGADTEPLSFGMVTAISTDLGNTAVFPALCSGGTLVLVNPAVAADTAALTAFVKEHPIDVLKITPSHLNALLVGPESAAVLPRRWLVAGGEALSWDLAARVLALGECRLLNHYGPTETTVGSCTMLVEDGPGPYASATVPIGRPLANTVCYVLDDGGRPVPEGVAGQLYVGGAGVARGYVAQPELTSERFVADSFAGEGARMYATGDLARRLPDGAIEFLGRADDQVKIRGFRIEPAEIEAALRAFPAVREAVVLAREDGRREHRLVAYVVGDGAAPEELRRHLTELVPEPMIPSAFVVLDDLPRTPSGKIDRLSLPAPEDAETGAQRAYVAPRTPIEETVAEIWTEVLGVGRVGVDDDFFALGGHSLLATQIVARVRSDFSIDLPLHALFTSPTVAALSQQIVDLLGKGGDEETEELLAQLEGLSDEEAERLLAGELGAEE